MAKKPVIGIPYETSATVKLIYYVGIGRSRVLDEAPPTVQTIRGLFAASDPSVVLSGAPIIKSARSLARNTFMSITTLTSLSGVGDRLVSQDDDDYSDDDE